MTNKYVKKCLTFATIRKMQINTILKLQSGAHMCHISTWEIEADKEEFKASLS